MSLNVWHHPDVLRLLREIASVSNASYIDRFFWLKAAPSVSEHQSNPQRIRLFSDETNRPPGSFRIANIVLQGGGVLGLAHAGFVTGLEKVGVRFVGIAGASAGAIMATGMVAVRGNDLLTETHKGVVKIIGAIPMSSFIDGPYRTRRLIKQFLLKRQSFGPRSWAAWIGAIRQIFSRRGLNPGDAFEDWLRAILQEHGLRSVDDMIHVLDDIAAQLNEALEGAAADGATPLSSWDGDVEGQDLLQIMAACMPIGVKFQFPRDTEYLAASVRTNSPAALVRASMSIPIFFEPIKADVNGKNWGEFIQKKLKNFLDREKLIEFASIKEVAFLDGGILSNLPVDAFSSTLPDVPTIAVPLTSSAMAKPYHGRASLGSLIRDAGTVAFMVRNQRDRDAVEQFERREEVFNRRKSSQMAAQARGRQPLASMPPSFPFRVASVNVKTANWLNFVMDEIEMMELFILGLERARDFLVSDLK